MKKSRSLYYLIFIIFIMLITIKINITYADSTSPQSDKDIPSGWAKEEIDKAIAAKLIPEDLLGDYRKNITREEFCEFVVSLYNALGGQAVIVKGENLFTDTQNINVEIANELGIVNGVGNGKFAPDNAITRQEISVMLYRTLQIAKPNYDYSVSSTHVFADKSLISDWAREAVNYLYGIEVINGEGENLFNPLEDTSREQAIVFVERLYEKTLVSNNNVVVSRGAISRKAMVMQAKLAELIEAELGKPYKWGAAGPDAYDCSGLVYSLFGKLGIDLPRTSSDQAEVGTYVPKDELMYGDLILFARDGKNVNHVGIYVGDGMFVHSPETGDVVKKSTLLSGYYERCYYTARRVIN